MLMCKEAFGYKVMILLTFDFLTSVNNFGIQYIFLTGQQKKDVDLIKQKLAIYHQYRIQETDLKLKYKNKVSKTCFNSLLQEWTNLLFVPFYNGIVLTKISLVLLT